MDDWKTPQWLMKIFDEWYDPCPLHGLNTSNIQNGLLSPWRYRTFVNPPYSNPLPWVEKAIMENQECGKTIVLLLKLDTSTKWFLKLQEAGAHFLTFFGRLKFSDKDSAPFPSVLAVLEGRKL